MLNLSTPTAPTLVGTVTGSLQAVSGPYGYGLLYPYSANAPTNTLLTYDVSAPGPPVLLGQAPLPLPTGTLLAAAQGRAVFTVGDANPRNPTSSSSQLPVQGYNATTATAPTLVGTDTNVGGAFSLVGNSSYVYAAVSNGLRTYATASILAARASTTTTPLPVYPNPATGTLHLPQLPATTPVTICDALGRLCLQTTLPTSGTLDIRSLRAGL